MPLLGAGAMLLSFDVEPGAIAEHDHWHTVEHLPERLSIPGFLRGTRWTAIDADAPRYLVLYEVESVATLGSAPYLERLDSPSPWTAKMMPHYRGMRRGLCRVLGSFGFGAGGTGLLVRFVPRADAAEALHRRLLADVLPALPAGRGIGGAHLLVRGMEAPMTNEQRIRGADAGVDAAVLVTAYDEGAVADAADRVRRAVAPGADGVQVARYRLHHTLSRTEVAAGGGAHPRA